MYPKIFNFIDSYVLLIVCGLALAFLVFFIYFKKRVNDRQYLYSLAITLLITVMIGFLGALGTQELIDLISGNHRHFALTFYGGLLFGVTTFFLLYFLWLKKGYKYASLPQILIICPGCITLAHAFGRIGCFLSGCCYGIETDSWMGVLFPGHINPRYPTQLFEAIYLFLLTAVLLFLAFKKDFKYNFSIYLISYGIWRFLIEFIRGDDRGSYLLNLSPAQWFSILAFIGGVISIIVIIKYHKKKLHKYYK